MKGIDRNYSLSEIETTASWLWGQIKPYRVIAFHGEMGAGKTTLISALCTNLKVEDVVSSPTFSIINEYRFTDDGKPESIYHIDLYRLKNEQDAIDAGVEDCFYNGRYCFVEWPERTPTLLPEDTVHVYLHSVDENNRKIKIEEN
ncbi:MAG TPA: tRNA (adenosine(37)-N6)-threonylcarbamoyltransferase complex ATPase subunit type 1 TsaE [Niabella sp.]|nr:tRNA (adenosine(37)-N6)-threonylcarbamoyltransferase complex ATPase subunit type 1 TsaE [Niabella sp.]HQW13920.1 tRNA (adenosine(37)-N6)-threonylcarbamoyltransferase complex ATPase subunit type 1 TsaE [Niabella sp.]HQX19187.1 tRNA (adenosine(37)-N6)-threonylcarbamoyltransferase complex ATPase subunit type 1 TsaE [Niabella sp.]HQX41325.1 tRNA (adenosine(37)-N6)-threonylcarbamoyltransferase complex ATPase subunit type 1 TsaE [Niabella sp.]HRB06259.1 tRNA (adenosine(37)-N6)-threonylcarbamoyltra